MVGIQAGISADHVKHILEDWQQERWPLMPGILAAREQLSERFLPAFKDVAVKVRAEGMIAIAFAVEEEANLGWVLRLAQCPLTFVYGCKRASGSEQTHE